MNNIGIVKKVLSSGRGPLPEYVKDTKVWIDYEVLVPKVDTTKEGFPEDQSQYKSVDNTKKQWPDGYGEPLELVIGRKFQLPVLETCVKSMHVNEICQFDIEMKQVASFPLVAKKLRDISRARVDPKYVHHEQHHCAGMGVPKTGYKELDDLIENPRDLRFRIHLLRLEQPDEYHADNWQLNPEQRQEKVKELKERANGLVREGKHSVAIDEYKEALTLLDQLMLMEKPGEPEWKELEAQTVPLYSNLALCYLALQSYREAGNAATEALKRDPTNEKALFRRAKARVQLYEFDEAEEDLSLFLEHYPNNEKLVLDERKKLSSLKSDKTANENNLFKKMVAK
ncbi:unnamed protein product [Bursaphelenchus okinawaensis]|uniref:AIP/AIPL N-terminal FKBP-type PPIase domain-containing protein n=1 Tax=Bursaphelenchus okinawaensis TaxID=465554 RepID=A0A811JU48_9BILA|nr:unnamed protein product [Bursaphelenchus okinawaensis]CAG9083597.1 unnamed protein product [Bursaphelenchus okinawaensis]